MDGEHEPCDHPGKDYEAQMVSNLKGDDGEEGPFDYDLRRLLFSSEAPKVVYSGVDEFQEVAAKGWGQMTPLEVLRLTRRYETAVRAIEAERKKLDQMRWQGTAMILGAMLFGMVVIYLQALIMGPKGMVP